MKVTSTYKNPDKYIKQLKREAKRAWGDSEDNYQAYEEEIGKLLFNYGENSFLETTLNDRGFGKLKVRERISIIGTVEETTEKVVCFDNGENESTVKIRLMQVRRLGE